MYINYVSRISRSYCEKPANTTTFPLKTRKNNPQRRRLTFSLNPGCQPAHKRALKTRPSFDTAWRRQIVNNFTAVTFATPFLFPCVQKACLNAGGETVCSTLTITALCSQLLPCFICCLWQLEERQINIDSGHINSHDILYKRLYLFNIVLIS